MGDENNKADSTLRDDESRGPMAGERLAEARRAQQIPLIEIAKEIHLDEYKVRALECNDFDVIGAPVFAKGHLRKYAQLVNVDVADVMADYYHLNRSAGAPPVVSKRPKPRPVVTFGPWIGALAALLLVLAAYWWFVEREAPVEAPVTGQIAPLPQEIELMDEPATDGVDAANDSGLAETSVIVPPEPQSQPEILVVTDPADMRLSISYAGDCWTEITDADGRRLYRDLGQAGSTIELSGKSPFSVLFGDVANVSLLVNGNAFDIPAADRRGRTARLTIAGS